MIISMESMVRGDTPSPTYSTSSHPSTRIALTTLCPSASVLSLLVIPNRSGRYAVLHTVSCWYTVMDVHDLVISVSRSQDGTMYYHYDGYI